MFLPFQLSLKVIVPLQDWVCQAESSRLQQTLCINIYQGFVFAYESLLASQVRLYCKCIIVLRLRDASDMMVFSWRTVTRWAE